MPRIGLYSFVYANADERTGDTRLVDHDRGKLARQLDNNSLWVLEFVDPVTWAPAGDAAGSGGEVLIDGGAALLFDDAGDLVYEG